MRFKFTEKHSAILIMILSIMTIVITIYLVPEGKIGYTKVMSIEQETFSNFMFLSIMGFIVGLYLYLTSKVDE